MKISLHAKNIVKNDFFQLPLEDVLAANDFQHILFTPQTGSLHSTSHSSGDEWDDMGSHSADFGDGVFARLLRQFGQILDIVALKTLKMRGQAFVIFKEIQSATNAMRAMQGFPFYDKPMKIAYSKSDSDMIAKQKGTFKERGTKRKEEEKKKKKGKDAKGAPAVPAAGAVSDFMNSFLDLRGATKLSATICNNITFSSAGGLSSAMLGASPSVFQVERQTREMRRLAAESGRGKGRYWGNNTHPERLSKPGGTIVPPRPNLFNQPPPVHGAGGIGVPEQPPNQILFLTNLPDETSEMMLSMLFTQPRPPACDRQKSISLYREFLIHGMAVGANLPRQNGSRQYRSK
ncbi:U1 small nuclear ribonucleoprotein A [Chionoecetes opilio]|uniref:U1 small nuclear ribonucleoprotein A n=1 Tax=Chionoecetes opilio TaxID=41210 RepID=A0A8J5CSD5_CHIOP|nr:U1 small nuclear ribonucleoprotein A [Chionoecetes opilio]